MNKLLAIFMFTMLLSCHSSETEHFAAINNFNLKPDVLKNGDPVRLIYCSRPGDRNDPIRYLIQLVAVKVETGDTVNILTDRTDEFRQDDGGEIFRFKDYDELTLALITESKEEIKKVMDNDSIKIDELASLNDGHLIMVVQDPKFSEIGDNKFPTAIGEVVR